MHWILKVILLCFVIAIDSAQSSCESGSCFPSTGDLLVGRGNMLHSTSTCGLNDPEEYCIVSHLKDDQKCFICDAQVSGLSHAVQNVITTFNDRLETWWQARNGIQDVSIQLDLEAEFQFTHAIMTFKTFRPAAMFIERSMDFGKTWNIYRYFAYDCERSFPDIPQWPPQEIDDVVCDNRYSMIEPSSQGNVIYKVLEPFIPIEDPYAPKIQNLLKITNLRFNFTELHTLGDDLLDAREDIKSKYYYSLYELVVRGNCFCYGHADTCTPIHPTEEINGFHGVMVHGRCQCQHNTIGLNCEQCKPFYQDQPWRPAEVRMAHECQPCNCNGHATECHFDPAVYEATGGLSGGVCDNCQHNTVGRQCEQCAPYFYQDPLKDIRDPTVCAECDCEVSGSLDGGICDSHTNPDQGMIAGQCRCKRNVEGPRCDRCKAGYFGLDENNLDGCTACDCDSLGTLSGANTCDHISGQCNCKRYTSGRRCDVCLSETWGMSALPQGCNLCDCDIGGAYDNDCNQFTGQCNCRPNINSRRCDVVVSGNFLPGLDFYLFEAEDAIIERDAYQDIRSRDNLPVTWTGDGFMMVREGGAVTFIVDGLPASMDYHLILRYQSNEPNEWKYVEVAIDRPNSGNIPTHSPCGNTRPDDDNWMTSLPGPPATHSSLGIICLEEGYTYRATVDLSRYQEEPFPNSYKPDILLDSLVVVPVHTSLDMFQGNIDGQERSRQFDDMHCLDGEMYVPNRDPSEECGDLMFSMSAIIHDGARPCDCDPQGSQSSICDGWGGQCQCKPNVIGRRCDRCAPGTYGFGPTGCRPCECDARGSNNQFCNRASGQCACQTGVSGRRCDRCKAGHYQFPYCLACSCNGHTESCDQDTGICITCRDFTQGEHCEECIAGYYGSPTLGSVDQCKPCLCPGGPNSGRQFASGCRFDYSTSQLQCFCLSGYDGSRCDRCAPAHWGNPNSPGGLCRECNCNGNVDPLDSGACDAATGICTGCLYDTAGPHCELCRDFYFGNAIDRSCRACNCNLLGTEPSECVEDQCRCDAVTGQCSCLPNVAGRSCDQCEPNHWKLASGRGCEACNCNLDNSDGPSCNAFTGQCECIEGFGGRTCDDCAYGHFGNPDVQCYSCDCDPNGSISGECHTRTGNCQCKPGVGGRRCNRCLRGFTGQVPHCEPCGECFDNWDAIINDLKERTELAIDEARKIGESGLPGSFEKEFQEIERVLDSIPLNISKVEDDLEKLINLIKTKLAEQEQRLRKLEDDMERIQVSDEGVNDLLDDLEKRRQDLLDKLEDMKAQTLNITKASPVAAFKIIEDAAQRSMIAEEKARAATMDDGSLVKQSEDIREEVERIIDDKKTEFDDKLSMVEDEFEIRESEVNELTLSKLNEDVCGVATEGCDDLCGGAGCETCGGYDCKGSVEFAKEAKKRSQSTQEILTEFAIDMRDLSSRVMLAKENAQEAKEEAQRAKDRAQEVEEAIREQNIEIRNLIQDIRKFLNDDKANPADIKRISDQVLALELPVDKQEIDELSRRINELVSSLPDVDNTLEETDENLEIANDLLNKARLAKAAAEAVAGDVTAVVEALKEANMSSQQAETAKNQAVSNIRKAENKINEINSATREIVEELNTIKNTLVEYQNRWHQVENNISNNQLDLDGARAVANDAELIAKAAVNALKGKRELIENATRAVEDKTNKTDRIDRLRGNAERLRDEVNHYRIKLDDLDEKFSEQERTLDIMDEQLKNLARQAESLYASIKQREDVLRNCS